MAYIWTYMSLYEHKEEVILLTDSTLLDEEHTWSGIGDAPDCATFLYLLKTELDLYFSW